MKPYIISFACSIIFVSSSFADRIYFNSGDVLEGKLVGYESRSDLGLGSSPALDQEDRVLWSSPLLGRDASFALEDVAKMDFERGEDTKFDANTLAMLANGDVHEGNLVDISDDELILQTDYAGELRIKRWFVTQLRFPARSEFAYFGPNRLSEWIEHGEEGDWELIDGKLTTNTSEVIGLEKEGTDRAHISFDIEWEQRANFQMYIAANSAEPGELEDSFDISMSNGRVMVSRTHEGRAKRNRRAFRNRNKIPEFNESGGGRFDIYFIRSLGQVQIWFDGKLVTSWQDQEQNREGLGGSFMLENRSTSKLAIGNMEIIPWNGVAPKEGAGQQKDTALLPSDDGDRLVLINGDSVEGDIGDLADDQLALKAAGLDLKIPINRVRLLRLFNPIFVEFGKVPDPRQYNRDVRLRLKSGRSVTFRVTGSEDGQLLAYSEATGDVKLSPEAFSTASFDLYSSEQ